jgi:N-methylhydantoinase B
VIDDEGRHRFTVLAKAHQADIGNASPTTYMATARDVYEEGALIFPAVKVQEDYRDVEDILRLCAMRIRVPEQWRGDYLASVGAARIGERELLALAAEIGWDPLMAFVEAWFDYSEHRMAMALGRLPAGRVTATSVHDPFPGTPDAGVPVHAVVEIDSAAARIEVDLRGNLDCLPCGLNLTEATARTTAMIGIFNGIGATVPPNAGSFRRIGIQLREGCVVGIPRHPTSCSLATTNLADRVINAVQGALATLGEGFGLAEHGAIMTAADGVISGRDSRRAGAPFVNQVILGMTLGGASPTADGWLTVLTPGTAGMGLWDSVEIDELHYPIRVRERRLLPDSEGAGRFRGAGSRGAGGVRAHRRAARRHLCSGWPDQWTPGGAGRAPGRRGSQPAPPRLGRARRARGPRQRPSGARPEHHRRLVRGRRLRVAAGPRSRQRRARCPRGLPDAGPRGGGLRVRAGRGGDGGPAGDRAPACRAPGPAPGHSIS